MDKILINNKEEYDEWYSNNKATFYMHGPEKPDDYPCIIAVCEISERNSRKDSLYYQYIYIEDFKITGYIHKVKLGK